MAQPGTNQHKGRLTVHETAHHLEKREQTAKLLRLSIGSTYTSTTLYKWRAHLLCSEITLDSTAFWTEAGPIFTNIHTKLFLLTLSFDLKKLWMKWKHNRLQTHMSLKLTSFILKNWKVFLHRHRKFAWTWGIMVILHNSNFMEISVHYNHHSRKSSTEFFNFAMNPCFSALTKMTFFCRIIENR